MMSRQARASVVVMGVDNRMISEAPACFPPTSHQLPNRTLQHFTGALGWTEARLNRADP
jgi:hypothetical protein